MGKITVETCEIEGLKVITPTVFGDDRGYFMETYNYNDFAAAGIDVQFVQDNQSMSVKGVLRGLHFQKNFPQTKLVRAIKGCVFDVAVDLRAGSATYGKWYGVLLTEENKKYLNESFENGMYVEGYIVLNATVKAAQTAEFRIGAWLLEDGIYAKQTNGTEEWMNTHDNAIRQRVDSESLSGLDLGSLAAGEKKDAAMSLKISSTKWNRDNFKVMVIVSAKNAKGQFDVANVAICPMNDVVAYDYK